MGIREIENGVWQVDIVQSGKRIRRRCKTQKEARQLKKRLRADALEPESRRMLLVCEVISLYHQTCSEFKTCGENEKLILSRLEDHLKNKCEVRFIDKIKTHHIETLQRRLQSFLSPSTVNRHFVVYRHFFNKCIEWEMIERSPCRVKALPVRIQKRKLWRDWQQREVINAFSDWCGDVCFVFAHTAIRIASLVSLKWRDVDFDNGVISVWTKKGGGGFETHHPMREDIQLFLLKLREKEMKKGLGKDTDLVFTKPDGSAIKAASVTNKVSKFIRKRSTSDKSFKDLTLYSWRHTLVTKVAENCGVYEASQIAGHRSTRTTESYYINTATERLKQAINRVRVEVEPPKYGKVMANYGDKKLISDVK